MSAGIESRSFGSFGSKASFPPGIPHDKRRHRRVNPIGISMGEFVFVTHPSLIPHHLVIGQHLLDCRTARQPLQFHCRPRVCTQLT